MAAIREVVLRSLPDGRYFIQLDPNPLTFSTHVSDEVRAMLQEIRESVGIADGQEPFPIDGTLLELRR